MIRSLIKPVNLLLAGSSYLASTFGAGSNAVRGMPVSVSAELTNHCNLNCPECSSGSGQMKRERGFMDIELFKKIIRELKPFLYNINLYFQGEPMLHPLFHVFAESCRGIHSVVSTNGHYLTEENAGMLVTSGLSKLIVSVDGADQETYSAYRINGNLEKVIRGVKLVSEAKKKRKSPLKLEIQLLVNRVNEHQIQQVKMLAENVKASFSVKSMQIINKENIGSWLPQTDRFRRYELQNGNYINKNLLPDRCARLWFNPVITWDGKVVPCCFDKDAEHVMGDLNSETFREIWNGPRYRVFRKSILTDRSMTEICRNCTSGLKGAIY